VGALTATSNDFTSVRSRHRFTFVSLFTASLLASAANARADVPSHDIGGGLHLAISQVRDDLLVPLRFSGPGAGISFGHAFDDGGFRFESRFRLTASVLFDRYGTTNAALLPNLDLGAHRHVTSFGDTQLALGAFLSLKETVLYPMAWDDAHAYWLGVTSIGPSARLLTPMGKRHMALELGMPIVGLVARPPRHRLYKVDNLVNVGFWFSRFADEPKLTSVHELQALRLRATWQGKGRGFRIDPFAELDFETFSEPVRMVHVSLHLGAEARFGL